MIEKDKRGMKIVGGRCSLLLCLGTVLYLAPAEGATLVRFGISIVDSACSGGNVTGMDDTCFNLCGVAGYYIDVSDSQMIDTGIDGLSHMAVVPVVSTISGTNCECFIISGTVNTSSGLFDGFGHPDLSTVSASPIVQIHPPSKDGAGNYVDLSLEVSVRWQGDSPGTWRTCYSPARVLQGEYFGVAAYPWQMRAIFKSNTCEYSSEEPCFNLCTRTSIEFYSSSTNYLEETTEWIVAPSTAVAELSGVSELCLCGFTEGTRGIGATWMSMVHRGPSGNSGIMFDEANNQVEVFFSSEVYELSESGRSCSAKYDILVETAVEGDLSFMGLMQLDFQTEDANGQMPMLCEDARMQKQHFPCFNLCGLAGFRVSQFNASDDNNIVVQPVADGIDGCDCRQSVGHFSGDEFHPYGFYGKGKDWTEIKATSSRFLTYTERHGDITCTATARVTEGSVLDVSAPPLMLEAFFLESSCALQTNPNYKCFDECTRSEVKLYGSPFSGEVIGVAYPNVVLAETESDGWSCACGFSNATADGVWKSVAFTNHGQPGGSQVALVGNVMTNTVEVRPGEVCIISYRNNGTSSDEQDSGGQDSGGQESGDSGGNSVTPGSQHSKWVLEEVTQPECKETEPTFYSCVSHGIDLYLEGENLVLSSRWPDCGDGLGIYSDTSQGRFSDTMSGLQVVGVQGWELIMKEDESTNGVLNLHDPRRGESACTYRMVIVEGSFDRIQAMRTAAEFRLDTAKDECSQASWFDCVSNGLEFLGQNGLVVSKPKGDRV